jgi:hypothetical protein
MPGVTKYHLTHALYIEELRFTEFKFLKIYGGVMITKLLIEKNLKQRTPHIFQHAQNTT